MKKTTTFVENQGWGGTTEKLVSWNVMTRRCQRGGSCVISGNIEEYLRDGENRPSAEDVSYQSKLAASYSS